MMKFILFILLLGIAVVSYSHEEQDSISRSVMDTVDYGKYEVILFDNYTWKYVEHERVINEIRIEDSIRIFNYIYANKIYKPDTGSLFTDYWDTLNVHAYGGFDYYKVIDTMVILLICDTSVFTMPTLAEPQSPFGWRGARIHSGIDIKNEAGDTILAAFDGIVRYAGFNRGGYGNLVIIRHFSGLETYYAHLSKISVNRNQYIKSGEVVGLAGRTGRAFGDHLHFEIRYMDNPFDPELIIDFENKKLKTETIVLMPEIFEHIKELSQAQYYTVAQGDTLWGISRRHGVSVNFICNLNGINQDMTLRIGQRLRVR